MINAKANPIRVGISACLLGEEVRYNGGHKRDDFLVETLGCHVEWVPVCPEVEVGLGTPRNTLRLVPDWPMISTSLCPRPVKITPRR